MSSVDHCTPEGNWALCEHEGETGLGERAFLTSDKTEKAFRVVGGRTTAVVQGSVFTYRFIFLISSV